jgi:hypothetical protein
MILELHPGIQLRKLEIGRERLPLLVIDNVVADPERLVKRAASRQFAPTTRYFPGVRAEAPLSYQHLVSSQLRDALVDCFGLRARAFRFSMCHFSLVTTPPDQLVPLQTVPHVDSLASDGLASIHYLFKSGFSGTAFYRHRQTGFESIDEARCSVYFRLQEAERQHAPAASGYINGDTAEFEQIAIGDAAFNRMLVYRRNMLHSGCIGPDFVPDANPVTGRLSINSFFDPEY